MGYAIGMLAVLVFGLAAAVWVMLGRLEFLEGRVRSLDVEQQRHCRMLTAHQQDGPRLEALESQLLRIQEEQARQVQGSR